MDLHYMPEMVEYNPRILQKVGFQEFSEQQPGSLGSWNRNTDGMSLRSLQHPGDKQLIWRVKYYNPIRLNSMAARDQIFFRKNEITCSYTIIHQIVSHNFWFPAREQLLYLKFVSREENSNHSPASTIMLQCFIKEVNCQMGYSLQIVRF